MMRRSLRLGLWLGLLLGVGAALTKFIQTRRALNDGPNPGWPATPDAWQPMTSSAADRAAALAAEQRAEESIENANEMLAEIEAIEEAIEIAEEIEAIEEAIEIAEEIEAIEEAIEIIEEIEAIEEAIEIIEEIEAIEEAIEIVEEIEAIEEAIASSGSEAGEGQEAEAVRPAKGGAAPEPTGATQPTAKGRSGSKPTDAARPATKATATAKPTAADKTTKASAKSTKTPANAATNTGAWVTPSDDRCPPSHPIKAKSSSRLFHLPGMFAYGNTKPDRCYESEAAAVADGYSKAKR